ncbi:MAG TPA: hypothetical protein VM639_02370 [Dongiaceae bacterium]|nr:hypothetical protein [Dongiaceae bacterium]
MSDQRAHRRPPKPPFHPYLVLGIAVVLPGVGQVINNQPNRGLLFLFTMIALGYVTYHLSTPEISLVGRYAGGLFMYALSLMDAYKWARIRWVIFHQPPPSQPTATLQKAEENAAREAERP